MPDTVPNTSTTGAGAGAAANRARRNEEILDEGKSEDEEKDDKQEAEPSAPAQRSWAIGDPFYDNLPSPIVSVADEPTDRKQLADPEQEQAAQEAAEKDQATEQELRETLAQVESLKVRLEETAKDAQHYYNEMIAAKTEVEATRQRANERLERELEAVWKQADERQRETLKAVEERHEAAIIEMKAAKSAATNEPPTRASKLKFWVHVAAIGIVVGLPLGIFLTSFFGSLFSGSPTAVTTAEKGSGTATVKATATVTAATTSPPPAVKKCSPVTPKALNQFFGQGDPTDFDTTPDSVSRAVRIKCTKSQLKPGKSGDNFRNVSKCQICPGSK